MAVLDGKKTLKNLLNKGFLKSNRDHNFLEFWHKGKYILQTHVSHNGQDINDYLIAKMKRQCHLEKEDFINLAICTLSEEGYVERLKALGDIDEESEKNIQKSKKSKKE